MSDVEFVPWPKISRLSRDCVVTEKIDGTNAQVIVTSGGVVYAASRTRLITPEKDNFGFAAWVWEHADELRNLGEGRHYGEWWGRGIQRGYGLNERRFSLFNTARWSDDAVRPACCHVVPVLYTGMFSTNAIELCVYELNVGGSRAAPGFTKPEGVIVFHTAASVMFKKTIEGDEKPKGSNE